MKLYEALDFKQRALVAIVGGGGKTSLMYHLADEIPAPRKVLLTTTTKILAPGRKDYRCFFTDQEDYQETLLRAIQTGTRAILASRKLQENNKLDGVKPETLSKLFLADQVDYILAEADGSKGRPLKGHLPHEPVIPPVTTHLVIMIGADGMGKHLDAEYVHRPEVAAELTGQKMGSVITPETIARLITHPQGIMRTSPPGAEKSVIINKIDCLGSLDDAYHTARLLLKCSDIKRVLLCSMHSKQPLADVIE
jgi:probable selenium-dependent hydroxylase accessory protein YqeC